MSCFQVTHLKTHTKNRTQKINHESNKKHYIRRWVCEKIIGHKVSYRCKGRPGTSEDREPVRENLAIHEARCPQTPHHSCSFPSLVHLQTLPIATLPSQTDPPPNPDICQTQKLKTIVPSSSKTLSPEKTSKLNTVWQFQKLHSLFQQQQTKTHFSCSFQEHNLMTVITSIAGTKDLGSYSV